MKASGQNTEIERRGERHALRRGLGTWEVTYEGRRNSFRDELGAEYVVWLLLHPPPQPIHAWPWRWKAGTRDGYLWVGTREGLARLDGVQLTALEQGAGLL